MTPRSTRHLRLAIAACAVLACAAPTLAGAQSFEGAITARSNVIRKDSPVTQVIQVKGTRWRLDMDMGMGEGGQGKSVMLADAEGNVTMLMPSRKTWMRPPAMQGRDSDALADYTFTATGKKDKVLDYECEYYEVRSASTPKQKSQWCITTALGNVGYAPLRDLGRGDFLRKKFPKGFFTLKVVDDKGKVEYEVVKVERRKLDDALFAPPADYREMKMPGMPNGRPK